MREPTIPKSGEEVKASTIADIIRWVKSIVPRGDGKTIKVKTSPGGSVISGWNEGGASAVKLVIGENLEPNIQYHAVYYNLDDTKDEKGTDCIASLMTPITDTIPSGTITFGFNSNTTIVSEGETYKVFNFDVPRWLDKVEP